MAVRRAWTPSNRSRGSGDFRSGKSTRRWYGRNRRLANTSPFESVSCTCAIPSIEVGSRGGKNATLPDVGSAWQFVLALRQRHNEGATNPSADTAAGPDAQSATVGGSGGAHRAIPRSAAHADHGGRHLPVGGGGSISMAAT